MIVIERGKGFEVSETLLEVLGFLHGAIDPDSGHIVCHHYRLGVFVAMAGGRPVPLFGIEGCLFVTMGDENTSAIVSGDDAVSVDSLSITGGSIAVGDVKIESYWALLALSFVREMSGSIHMYKLNLLLDGRSVKAAGILVKPKESQPVLVIVPSQCFYERREVATHM